MITDGGIDDIEETISAIREASKLPMHIIIVGVGDNDFANMDRLDECAIESRDRNIVEFIRFNDFMHDPE